MKTALRARAELVCVGTELLSGKLNTHASYFARRLRAAGLELAGEATVGDREADIEEAVRAALGRSPVLIVCGGLGPTFDDLTREAVSAALGRGLLYRPDLYRRIEARFKRYGRRVPPSNKRQAWLLEGARPLDNANGSAPGQVLGFDGKTVVLLPGPFSEMSPMFEDSVLPLLRKSYGRPSRSMVWRFAGVAEAAADARLSSLIYSPAPGMEYTILAKPGLVELHASCFGAKSALARADREVRRRMGRFLYGCGGDALESVVGARLKDLGWTLATAESCTGGLLSGRITSAAGSSDYYLGGVIAYDNRLKRELLGVSTETLKSRGAVSAECAKQMAEGARRRLGSDIALSATGIAGPGGGSAGKPVGTVYVGLAMPRRTIVKKFLFPGDREGVRDRTVTAALDLLRLALP